MFQNMFLEQEQKDLLATLVEASRNVASNQREPFMFVATMDGSWIQHRGLQSGKCEVYQGDLQILKDLRLISIVYSTNHMFNFDVSPLGFRYYEEMKKQQGMPTLRIEGMLKSHLDARRFQSEYKIAYQKWSEAEAILWGSDSEQQLTTIGHLSREAMQEFATALVERYQLAEVDQEKSHTIARVKAVLKSRADQLGEKEVPFLEALVAYWGTVSDLVQRQVHGAQKEGEPLIWEDARRIVFQTAVVMLEIDSALSKNRM